MAKGYSIIKQGSGGGFLWRLYGSGRLTIYKTNGQRMVHTERLEEKLGRRLTRGEQTHHLNGNTLDNRFENLECLTTSKHSRLHWEQRRQSR